MQPQRAKMVPGDATQGKITVSSADTTGNNAKMMLKTESTSGSETGS